MASSRRTISCKSSACSFSAATVSMSQDAKVADTVPSNATPPTIRPNATTRPSPSHRIVVPVTDGGHGRDRPPHRIAEAFDVGVWVRSLGVKDRERGAESQQRRSPGDIDRHTPPQPGLGSAVDHQKHRNQSEQLQRPEEREEDHQGVVPMSQHIAQPLIGKKHPDHEVNDEDRPRNQGQRTDTRRPGRAANLALRMGIAYAAKKMMPAMINGQSVARSQRRARAARSAACAVM